jgi:hypothetical protein
VDDAASVRVPEPREDLIDDRPDERERERPEVFPRVERAALDVVHDQVRRAVGERAVVAGADDGRVIERREGARLLEEPNHVLPPRLRLLEKQHLQRHVFFGHPVVAQVDRGHATTTELPLDEVTLRYDVCRSKDGRRRGHFGRLHDTGFGVDRARFWLASRPTGALCGLRRVRPTGARGEKGCLRGRRGREAYL